MRPKTKYAVIHRHRNEYPISVMCKFFEVSRSGYYDFVKRLGNPEKDADLAEKIRLCQESTDKTYGYRRVWLWLERKNIKRNPKTVLRVMKKYGLPILHLVCLLGTDGPEDSHIYVSVAQDSPIFCNGEFRIARVITRPKTIFANYD